MATKALAADEHGKTRMKTKDFFYPCFSVLIRGSFFLSIKKTASQLVQPLTEKSQHAILNVGDDRRLGAG